LPKKPPQGGFLNLRKDKEMDKDPNTVPDIEGRTTLEEDTAKYPVGRIALTTELGGEQSVEPEIQKPKPIRGLPIL
jgi:hypothetical protein